VASARQHSVPDPLPQGNLLNDTWASAPKDVWAVGDGGTILHFDGTSPTTFSNGKRVIVETNGTNGRAG
jgi:hypothetical protein